MTLTICRSGPTAEEDIGSSMTNPPFSPHPGTISGPQTEFHLDRRRLCSVALASLIVPGAVHLSRPDDAPRIVIRDGWILLETDL
jgi:hypothetical protein